MICCVPSGAAARRGAGTMIEMRRSQPSFGDGLIAAEVDDLREPWMQHADAVLRDDELVAMVHAALARRRPHSRRRGPAGTAGPNAVCPLDLQHLSASSA